MPVLAHFTSMIPALPPQDNFVYLNFSLKLVERFPLHHGLPNFMAHEPGGPVGFDPQLLLQGTHGDPFGRMSDQINRPKPLLERQMATVKHRSSRSRKMLAARVALEDFPGLDKPHGTA